MFTEKDLENRALELKASKQLPSALEDWHRIEAECSNRRLLVCLDYDGTLTPIVDDPEEAALSPRMQKLVFELSSLTNVAVVSGRDKSKVERFVGISDIFYAGSHGLDISTPDGINMQPEEVTPALSDLGYASIKLKEELAVIANAEIERKRFAITVHYRKVKESDLPLLKKILEEIAKNTPQLRIESGKKIFEFKPKIDWDKGAAISWIARYIANGSEPLVLYLGDDVTDEAAFQKIQSTGLPILVGDTSYSTYARHKLSDVDQVFAFLEKLADHLKYVKEEVAFSHE